jgi:glycosyltransferase involved in cell wall biosynthesis
VRRVVVLPVRYHVVFYCPDRHIAYDGRTPDRVGVGGGITARVRMARALRRLGHRVTMVVNCPRPARIDGVDYRPLDSVHRLEGDVLVANTSGGALDLSPLLDLETDARLRLVWVHGTARPGGLDRIGFDALYAVSNFVAEVAAGGWGVPRERLFVVYNGFEERTFARAERRRLQRDPYRLVYFSHPSKGLGAAIAVLRRLRQGDPRFTLHVYGGPGLWGQEEAAPLAEEGLVDHGLVGQRMLAAELLKCGFSLQLQSREEPGALAIVDAMRAGCVIIGSSVGCYPEMIDGKGNGFLVPGDPASEDVLDRAASLVLGLVRDPDALKRVRQNAQAAIWDTDTLARAWTAHWAWLLESSREPVDAAPGACPRCGGERLSMDDGYHCLRCSFYSKHAAEAVR